VLGGPTTARIFRRGEKPIEATAGSDIRPLVEKTFSPVGHAALNGKNYCC
jgi:hypothetical protein